MQEINNKRRNGRMWAGLFLTGIGAVLLLKQIGIFFPYWFFTWPVFLIGLGIFLGLRHGFKGPTWIILILIGSIFLADFIQPELDLRRFTLPIAFIAFGLVMLFRSKKINNQGEGSKNWNPGAGIFDRNVSDNSGPFNPGERDFKSENYVDSVAIFGGVSKVIVSKDFKGGDLVAIFGGNELDLGQADIQGPIVIDFVQIMGGSKLIVPAHWEIRSEMVAIFGGIEDKRKNYAAVYDPNKILILKGTSIFGGIEIRNY
ncbi:MAG: DUF5668 domain-containing protein [Chitinophagaceae bacterium]